MFLDCVSTVKWGTKTFVKPLLSKRLKIGFQYQLSLNAGQKYCILQNAAKEALCNTFDLVACEERAFRIVERLIENPIAEQMFLDCVSTVKPV